MWEWRQILCLGLTQKHITLPTLTCLCYNGRYILQFTARFTVAIPNSVCIKTFKNFLVKIINSHHTFTQFGVHNGESFSIEGHVIILTVLFI
jgi:hypothetical protein